MLDGVTSVNTGGNQPGINLNYDSVAEVKVLTSTYSAEYGRSSGLQVVGYTKSGTNYFSRIGVRHREPLELGYELVGERAQRRSQIRE